MKYGFTFTEVIVALVVFELGLLGVAGLALHAHGILSQASLRSRAVAAVEEVADSLAVSGVRSGGRRAFPRGSVSWMVGATARVRRSGGTLRNVSITAADTGGEGIFTVRLIVPEADPSGAP